MKMSVLYRNDVDAERCRISLCEKSPVALFTLGSKNRVVWLSGVVHHRARCRRAMARRNGRSDGCITGRRRKTRQRAP
jgi:hypothetical protein